MANAGTGRGPDFDLSDEILSVMPTDPYDQLDLARRITAMAIASRVSKLEVEAGRLRQKIADRDRLIAELQDKVEHLDRLFKDCDDRLVTTRDENVKLSTERDRLSMTSKKLARDLAKLEAFKRQLMQSLNDQNLSKQLNAVDTGTSEHSLARISLWKGEDSLRYSELDAASVSLESGDSTQDGPRHLMHPFSITPYITPRLTPFTTPKFSSTDDSPRGFSTAGSSPRFLSGAKSPIKSRLEGNGSLSSFYSSSLHSSAPGSPPHSRSFSSSTISERTPRIDGKELFRQARTRLTYEQFAAFLATVKELNAQRQSREETLRKVEEICGTENRDLYLSFQGLLNRNLS